MIREIGKWIVQGGLILAVKLPIFQWYLSHCFCSPMQHTIILLPRLLLSCGSTPQVLCVQPVGEGQVRLGIGKRFYRPGLKTHTHFAHIPLARTQFQVCAWLQVGGRYSQKVKSSWKRKSLVHNWLSSFFKGKYKLCFSTGKDFVNCSLLDPLWLFGKSSVMPRCLCCLPIQVNSSIPEHTLYQKLAS